MDSRPAQQPGRIRVHVHLDHGRSPRTWTALYERGDRMSATAYGYEHASPLVDVTFSEDAPDSGVRRAIRRLTRHYLGVDLIHAVANRRAITSADIIWTHTEFEWHTVSLLMRLRLMPRTPVLAQSVWLWDDWERLNPIRRLLARFLVNEPIVHVLQSRENEAVALRRSRRPVVFVPFGIAPLTVGATRDRARGSHDRLRILAAGNDRDRDWEVLMRAAVSHAEWDVRILSGRAVEPPPGARNIVVERSAKPARVRESFEWADMLVTPVRPNLHASGITVALEALSAGVRQVCTDTGGLADYLDGLVSFMPPQDAVGLEAAIADALARPAAAPDSIHRRGLTDRDYALRLAKLSVALLSDRPAPSAVSAFERQ